MRGDKIPHAERCRAMTAKGQNAGQRCRYRHGDGLLCDRHLKAGAVLPDDWTQPDNLPVFYAVGGGDRG